MDHYWFASVYDMLLFPFMKRLRKTITRVVIAEKAQKIVDVCCGTGDQLKYLKKAGIDGVGVDLSKNMLNVAQKGRWKQPCYLEDASNMPFDDNSFDMAIITLALHEKEPVFSHRIVNEIYRIIESGGKLVLVDYLLDNQCPSYLRKMVYFIERVAGKQHYKNFKAYIQNGGLEALFDKHKFGKKKTLSYGKNAFTVEIWQKL